MKDRHMIISIGRECGSGGQEIAERLAAHYGIKLYNRNIIEKLAQKLNKDPEVLEDLDENTRKFLFPARKGGFAAQEGVLMNKLTKADCFYLQEKSLIKELAEKESFVIVGRAANAILADDPDTLKLYIYASDEFKIPRVKEYYHLDSDKEALKKMQAVDRTRQDYFHYYSNMVWGSTDGHDLMIDSSAFGIDETVNLIIDVADRKFGSAELQASA